MDNFLNGDWGFGDWGLGMYSQKFPEGILAKSDKIVFFFPDFPDFPTFFLFLYYKLKIKILVPLKFLPTYYY